MLCHLDSVRHFSAVTIQAIVNYVTCIPCVINIQCMQPSYRGVVRTSIHSIFICGIVSYINNITALKFETHATKIEKGVTAFHDSLWRM